MSQLDEFRLFPHAASTIAPQVDAIFWVLFGISGAIVIGISIWIIFCISRFHNAPIAIQPLKKPSRRAIELTWTILPLLSFLTIFAWGAFEYFKMHVAPADSGKIYVVAKQWMWKFQHANGIREINTLHVPVGKPFQLVMSSEDVIHSFFVPDFRIKQDVVPGRYNYTWFEATMVGRYHLFCAQYCGTDHSRMTGVVVVMKPEDYQNWVATRLETQPKQGPSGLAARGRALFNRLGCISCHGQPLGKKAPDLNGLYMSKVGLSNGRTVIADENYIRQSILNPDAKIVMGYKSIMPSFQGQVSEQEVLQLISYIKSLQHSERKP